MSIARTAAEHDAQVAANPHVCRELGRPGGPSVSAAYCNACLDALDREAAEHDRRTTVTYSGGQHTAEALYVDETRGR